MNRFVLFLSILGLSVSCAKESSHLNGNSTNAATIGVNVTESDDITKSASGDGELFDSFVIDTLGDNTIRIDGYVSDFCPEATDYQTKAVKDGAITLTSSLTTFWMSAFADEEWHDNTLPDGAAGSITNPNAAGVYFSGYPVSKDGTSGAWSIEDAPKWINDVDMSFWSWMGSSSSTISPEINSTDHTKAKFSYTNNGVTDWIFAFNAESRTFDRVTGEITEGTGTYNTGYKDKIDILFHHALAAIRFDISGLKNDGFSIKKIVLKGVANYAECQLEGSSTRAVSFAWDNYDGTTSFTRVFDADDFTETGLDGTTTNALMPMSSDMFIFVIPQDVKDEGITMELTYEDASGEEKTLEASLDHDTPWTEGKYYTYKLSVDGKVSVTVSDSVTATLKSNVSIKNDGGKSAFIRASIVAYWVDASGNYLSSCDYKTQGTLVGLATGNWSENTTDGFFYYDGEVTPGTDIGPSLLESYAPGTAPISEATLRMVITAQAIEYDSNIASCYAAFNN